MGHQLACRGDAVTHRQGREPQRHGQTSRAGSLTRGDGGGGVKTTSSDPAAATSAAAQRAATHAAHASQPAATTTWHAHGHPGACPGLGHPAAASPA